MEAEAGHAVQQLARLTRRRDNLAALVERLSVLDGLSAGTAALGLLLEVCGFYALQSSAHPIIGAACHLLATEYSHRALACATCVLRVCPMVVAAALERKCTSR